MHGFYKLLDVYKRQFPDYPADIRAPQGSLTGVSGFQVHIGAGQVFTPGDRCHVLVAMNPSALKTQIKFCKPQGDRKSTRLNSSHSRASRMPSSA